MVWRDGPEWSDDSEVSNEGARLDRRRKLQHYVREVVATVQQEPGGWCECGHVLDTEGERHVLRSCTWKRRGRGQRGGTLVENLELQSSRAAKRRRTDGREEDVPATFRAGSKSSSQ